MPKIPIETAAPAVRPPRPRRQLILGAGATASLILTLANRPAFAAKTCNHSTWISWKGELTHPSQKPSPCIGDSPATWSSNADSLWAPNWGIGFTKSTRFTATFPAVTANGWSRNGGTDSLAGALAGHLIIKNSGDSGSDDGSGSSSNTLPASFPAQATAALLNINFYGDKYGTAENAQTIAALKSEVATALNAADDGTGQENINAFIAKYSALNTA